MRAQARTIPRSQHLQPIVRHRVGYPGRRSQSLRWRFHDSDLRISASRGFQSCTNSRRRTRNVRAVAPKRLENPPLRCRNDPARRANDQFRSVVETRSNSGSRLRRVFLDARKRTGAPLGQRNPKRLAVGIILPALALAMALPTQGWTLLRLNAYPLATYRIYNYYVKHRDITTKDAAIYPLSCVLAKIGRA